MFKIYFVIFFWSVKVFSLPENDFGQEIDKMDTSININLHIVVP